MIIIVGTVVEVGKMQCSPAGCNGNEAVIEVAKGRLIRVSGISDTVLRMLGANLFGGVLLSFEKCATPNPEAAHGK